MELGYNFDEGAGSIAAEVAGGPDITDILGWAAGLHGSALRVNLDAGPVITPWSVNTAFTIMFDFYINGAGANAYTVFLNDWENQGDSPFGNVQVTPGGNLEWYLGTGDTGVPIPSTTWKHIALTGDGAWRRIYVDAVQAGFASNANLSGTGPLVLGGFGGFEPNVRYDNLRIFDTALTQPEIAALAGTPVVGESGYAFWEWDGATKQPLTLLGEWNGTALDPISNVFVTE
jgi:hypothetical protein